MNVNWDTVNVRHGYRGAKTKDKSISTPENEMCENGRHGNTTNSF